MPLALACDRCQVASQPAGHELMTIFVQVPGINKEVRVCRQQRVRIHPVTVGQADQPVAQQPAPEAPHGIVGGRQAGKRREKHKCGGGVLAHASIQGAEAAAVTRRGALECRVQQARSSDPQVLGRSDGGRSDGGRSDGGRSDGGRPNGLVPFGGCGRKQALEQQPATG